MILHITLHILSLPLPHAVGVACRLMPIACLSATPERLACIDAMRAYCGRKRVGHDHSVSCQQFPCSIYRGDHTVGTNDAKACETGNIGAAPSGALFLGLVAASGFTGSFFLAPLIVLLRSWFSREGCSPGASVLRCRALAADAASLVAFRLPFLHFGTFLACSSNQSIDASRSCSRSRKSLRELRSRALSVVNALSPSNKSEESFLSFANDRSGTSRAGTAAGRGGVQRDEFDVAGRASTADGVEGVTSTNGAGAGGQKASCSCTASSASQSAAITAGWKPTLQVPSDTIIKSISICIVKLTGSWQKKPAAPISGHPLGMAPGGTRGVDLGGPTLGI